MFFITCCCFWSALMQFWGCSEGLPAISGALHILWDRALVDLSGSQPDPSEEIPAIVVFKRKQSPVILGHFPHLFSEMCWKLLVLFVLLVLLVLISFARFF